jgi:hypothetical protein
MILALHCRELSQIFHQMLFVIAELEIISYKDNMFVADPAHWFTFTTHILPTLKMV